MEYKIPESSIITPPHKIEGAMREARASFYELAKDKVRYFNHEEFVGWISEIVGEEVSVIYEDDAVLHIVANKSEETEGGRVGNALANSPAVVFMMKDQNKEEPDIEKYLTSLEIAIDTSKFNLNGKDFTDLLPFVIEHEIFEAWVRSKKGFLEEKEFSDESRSRAHSLALRRQFLLAEKAGKADKMLEWFSLFAPNKKEEEYVSAWENAKKKLHRD